MTHRIERRLFLQSVVAGVAVSGGIRAAAAEKKLPISFSTLGCPKWDWNTILVQAAQLGYAAIELRGLQGQMDLPKRPEFSGTQVQKSLGEIEARAWGLPRACMSRRHRFAWPRSTKASASSTWRIS